VTAQIIITADPLAADEDLWSGRDLVFGLERVRFLARAQVPVIDLETVALEQVERLYAIWAGMAGHHHPVDHGRHFFRHRHAPCE
jgi:hypothetical protein